MTDEERIAKATRSGGRMLGPQERQRCAKHPRRWEIWRWTWDVPEDGDHLNAHREAECLRSCSDCDAEDEE